MGNNALTSSNPNSSMGGDKFIAGFWSNTQLPLHYNYQYFSKYT